MPSNELNDTVQHASVVAGFLGATLGLSYAPKMTRGKSLIALATGWIVAVYGAPLGVALLEHWLSISAGAPLRSSVCFFTGLIALRLVPVLLAQTSLLKIPGTGEDK